MNRISSLDSLLDERQATRREFLALLSYWTVTKVWNRAIFIFFVYLCIKLNPTIKMNFKST
jgi:hypothetical protein